MSTEELMKPRYRVNTAWPPNNNYQPGDIVTGEEFTGWKPADYPIIFKRLQWWEEREEKDMPEYVRCIIDCRIPLGTILKANWETYTTSNEIAHRGNNPDFWIDAKYFLPATETEYNEHLKPKP